MVDLKNVYYCFKSKKWWIKDRFYNKIFTIWILRNAIFLQIPPPAFNPIFMRAQFFLSYYYYNLSESFSSVFTQSFSV